jgi:hypothetical protein
MAVRTYGDYDAPAAEAGYETTGSGLGGKIFIWVAWAAAAIFWGFTLSTGIGILKAANNPALTSGEGGMDLGGLAWFLMEVVGGVVVLGLAIAWGTARWASRNKAMDPVTEATTRAEYDMAEAAGGDDDIHRSPEARKPQERDAFRAVNRPMN